MNSPPTSGVGGGGYFPYILLNEIQTMFSQLDSRFVYMPFEGGTVSQYFILVTYWFYVPF